jgi:SSS family solute:Na+ symporter
MSATLVLVIICSYFALLLLISYFTGRKASNSGYFLGNKQTPWWVLAFGLIGDSLSGVTFVSVPGQVGGAQFSYMQIVFGYVFGYLVISELLLPIYYKYNLTSIYSYLAQRLGKNSQKTGSFFFLLSRTIGAAFRLYITLIVLNKFLFEPFGVSFEIAAAIIIILILVYTVKGGIKTLVWTDMLQSGFLLLGLIFSVFYIARELDIVSTRGIFSAVGDIGSVVANSDYSKIFFFDDWNAKNHFVKQFLGGAFIAIAMTGLDQNMMQKNLSARTLGEAKKNIRVFSIVVVLVNLVFVSLGALLFMYATQKGIAIPKSTDELFPLIAIKYLGVAASVAFILGIAAATFSSADSVLTTLTTAFCIDFLGMDDHALKDKDQAQLKRTRTMVHIGFSVVLLGTIILFRNWNNDAVITQVFVAANFTYGPLIGLFAFSMFTKFKVYDKLVPLMCIVPPVTCYFLNANSKEWFNGYMFGNELLILNGILTFVGLMLLINRKKELGV